MILDSGLCVLQAIIELKKKGVYVYMMIKKMSMQLEIVLKVIWQ